MALLLHAITPRSEASTRSSGLRGGELLHVDEANLRAWATVLPREGHPFTRDDLLEHHGIVSQLFETVDGCLPARFPTWVDDAPTVTELLRKRERQLTSQLAELSGCCEVAVTALWTTHDEEARPPEEQAPGRRYLLERRTALASSDRRRAQARALAHEIEQLAGDDLVRAETRICPSPNVALSEALLVKLTAASEIIERLRREHEVVRILVNGPWPPYTFAAVRSD